MRIDEIDRYLDREINTLCRKDNRLKPKTPEETQNKRIRISTSPTTQHLKNIDSMYGFDSRKLSPPNHQFELSSGNFIQLAPKYSICEEPNNNMKVYDMSSRRSSYNNDTNTIIINNNNSIKLGRRNSGGKRSKEMSNSKGREGQWKDKGKGLGSRKNSNASQKSRDRQISKGEGGLKSGGNTYRSENGSKNSGATDRSQKSIWAEDTRYARREKLVINKVHTGESEHLRNECMKSAVNYDMYRRKFETLREEGNELMNIYKMQKINIKKMADLENDYKLLLDAFDKSEKIKRQQQEYIDKMEVELQRIVNDSTRQLR